MTNIVTIAATIEGLTPLLQHRWTEDAEKEGKTRSVNIESRTPREEAARFAYIDKDAGFYIPGAAFARLLREAGTAHKQRGSRKSLKYVIPAAVLLTDDAVPLTNGDGKTRIADFEVDSRPVVIPATKGRIMRHRPRFDCWSATLNMEVDESVLDEEIVHQLLTEGGARIGVGDFRPEKGGPFGRFRVVAWDRAAD